MEMLLVFIGMWKIGGQDKKCRDWIYQISGDFQNL